MTCSNCAALAAENEALRKAVQTWEEFDFKHDNPARLVDHIMALMVDRNNLRRRLETTEAVIEAITGGGNPRRSAV